MVYILLPLAPDDRQRIKEVRGVVARLTSVYLYGVRF